MKNLKIQLTGIKGAGKTTVARLIHKALTEHGIDVICVGDKDFGKKKSQHDLGHCLHSLSARVCVSIETKGE